MMRRVSVLGTQAVIVLVLATMATTTACGGSGGDAADGVAGSAEPYSREAVTESFGRHGIDLLPMIEFEEGGELEVVLLPADGNSEYSEFGILVFRNTDLLNEFLADREKVYRSIKIPVDAAGATEITRGNLFVLEDSRLPTETDHAIRAALEDLGG